MIRRITKPGWEGPSPATPEKQGPRIHEPIMFLLEEVPVARVNTGEPAVPFCGYYKEPPTKHYYWIPHVECWPTELGEFNTDFSGPYYAYLMRRHHLSNVYITNAAKCGFRVFRVRIGRAATTTGLRALH